MRNLCFSLRSIFPPPLPDPLISSLTFFRRCPSSDSSAHPPVAPFQPLSRSLSLDRSSLLPPSHVSAGGQLLGGDECAAARESLVLSADVAAGFSVEKDCERELALELRVERLVQSPQALADGGNSADCSSASREADREDCGNGREFIPPHSIASNERAVERTAQKSFDSRGKIKLHHCTEALGSESSDAHEVVSSFDNLCESQSVVTLTEAKWKAPESLMQLRAAVQAVSVKKNDSQCEHKEFRSLGHKRKFPPPLNSYSSASASPDLLPSDSSSFTLRSYRKNGRFVLEEVKVPCQKYLRASRKDGRLRLELVTRTGYEHFARPQSSRDDFLEEESELDINSQGEEWEVAQSVTETYFSRESAQDDIEEKKEDSESQTTRTQHMIPIPKKTKFCIEETSSSSGIVGEKQLAAVTSEYDRDVMDSPMLSLTASLNRSMRKVERVEISKTNVEPHEARSLPCVGRLSAPLMKGDPLSSSNYSVLQCSIKQQTLPCHDMSSLLLLSGKPCRTVGTSNATSSEKKLLLTCNLTDILPPTGKMKKTITGKLEESSRLPESFGLVGDHGSEERGGKSKVGVSFEGARSLPSPSEWDLQVSFAGIYAALRRHDRFLTLPCKKELETSELDKCLKLHLVATNS